MKNFVIACLSISLNLGLTAQNCGLDLSSLEYEEALRNHHALMQQVYCYGFTPRCSEEVKRINVVVHIIYDSETEEGLLGHIPNAQVYEAIQQLNDLYRNELSEGTDTHIEFQLATEDVNGVVTTGIVKHPMETVLVFTKTGLSENTETYNFKQSTAWDPDLYLNVWVTAGGIEDPSSTGIIGGYASLPGFTNPNSLF